MFGVKMDKNPPIKIFTKKGAPVKIYQKGQSRKYLAGQSRKYLAVNKNGDIGARAIRGGRNLKENYVKVARSRGRNVYAKKGSGFENEGRTYITPPKKGGFRLIDFVPPERGGGGGGPGPKPPPEPPEGLVEVRGLACVEYEPREAGNVYFHAEMLFTWYGPRGYKDSELINPAVDFLIDTLSTLERIPWNLIGLLDVDKRRTGLEQPVAYAGTRYQEADYEVYIPYKGGKIYARGTLALRVNV